MPHRLLLADDSVTIQRVIELTFADEDVSVVAVSDGEAAIARLESEPFDIVLADIGMPKRGGYEIAEFVRGRPGLAGVPVILLTGAFDPVDRARVDAAAVAAVLVKPFEPQMLIAKVRELLDTRRTGTGDAPAEVEQVAPAATPAESSSPDDYFARLDRAFAALNDPLPSSPPAPREAAAPETPASAAPARQSGAAAPSGVAAPGGEVPPASALAQTFNTLLAVERGELPPSALQRASTVEVNDELIDRIARRVAERLGEGAVRELAADVVSETAERLVREEIDRIRRSVPDPS